MEAANEHTIYWTLWDERDWSLHVAATPQGLCYVGSPGQPFEQLADWARSRFAGYALVRDDAKLQPYTEQLMEYGLGRRTSFDMACDLRGTPFQLAVWDALRRIPYGQTETYSAIAERIQKPAAVRAVGAAIGANPVLITIPCHRVIGKNGTLTGYRGGLEMKKKLLQLERDGVSAQ